MVTKTILAVDDEEHILELLSYNLENSGYCVHRAESGEKALEKINQEHYDLILLDYMLPGIDGVEVLRAIRSDKLLRSLPVIMLTAKGDEISKVLGLEMGADDYLVKPFGIHELKARIRAVLRRFDNTIQPEEAEEERLEIDGLVMNKTRRTVAIEGREVELSLKEFELLYLLAKNKGRVFSRDSLLEQIWGYDYYGETRTVDVHIRNLRKKIEEDDTNPEYLKTVRGVGYKYIDRK